MKCLMLASLAVVVSSCTQVASTQQLAIQSPVAKNSPAKSLIVDPTLIRLIEESQRINNTGELQKNIYAAQQNPTNPEPLYNIAYIHMQAAAKNPAEQQLAIEYFNKVLAMVPGNDSVLNALYNIYYDNTYKDTSPTAFESAKQTYFKLPESTRQKLNPPSLARYAHLVIWQEKQHETNHQALRETLLQATQENPQSTHSYIQLAKLLVEDRYFALALATLKLAEENIKDSAELYRALAIAYDKRAQKNDCNYENKSDIVNAGKYYLRAISLAPEERSLHLDLAREFFDQNLWQLSLNENLIANELNHQTGDLAVMAENYSMLGFHQKANELLQQALDKGYGIDDSSYHQIQMNQGDWKKAAKGFESYLKTQKNYTVYDFIKSDIIAQQAQLNPWLADKTPSFNSEWEEMLFKYWSQKISADDLKKSAHNRCQKTEYYFYTGYRDYTANQKDQAKTKFNAALEQNTYRFIERPLARYFLQQIH